MTTPEENEASAERLVEEGWQNRIYAIIDELVAEDFVLHDPTLPEPIGGPDGYRGMAEMGATIVDGEMEVQQVFSTGDYVIGRWKQTGTHVGKLGAIEPTNVEVTIIGIDRSRFEDGKLVETWQEVNLLTMLMQIGVLSEDLFSAEMPPADD